MILNEAVNQPSIEEHDRADDANTEIQEESEPIIFSQEFLRITKQVMYGKHGKEFTYDSYFGVVNLPEEGKTLGPNNVLRDKQGSQVPTENGRITTNRDDPIRSTMEVYAKAKSGVLDMDTAGVINVTGRPVAKISVDDVTGEFISEEKPMMAVIEAEMKTIELTDTETGDVIENQKRPIIPDEYTVEIRDISEGNEEDTE